MVFVLRQQKFGRTTLKETNQRKESAPQRNPARQNYGMKQHEQGNENKRSGFVETKAGVKFYSPHALLHRPAPATVTLPPSLPTPCPILRVFSYVPLSTGGHQNITKPKQGTQQTQQIAQRRFRSPLIHVQITHMSFLIT